MTIEIQLPSTTYKFRVPEKAMYFTIVGEGKPIWLFVNSKEMDSYQWVTALMESYSRQIKACVEVSDIVEAMKTTFAPGGKYFIPDGTGREVHSIVHHLGLILEEHVMKIDKEPATK